jgi:hypothetical protein
VKGDHLQRLLMGMMLYLGGGLRKQVFVNLYTSHLQWDEEEMVMQVGQEKVARVNASHLPLPPQLFLYIEFFKQRVWPYLCLDPVDPPLALWLSGKGRPLNSKTFGQQLKQLIQQFNPELTTSAIDFRRMTVTDLFAGTTSGTSSSSSSSSSLFSHRVVVSYIYRENSNGRG